MCDTVTILLNVTFEYSFHNASVRVVHVVPVTLISYNVLSLGQPIAVNYRDPKRAGRCNVNKWYVFEFHIHSENKLFSYGS